MSNADDTIAADIMAVEVIIFRVTPSYRNSQFHLHQGIRSKNSNENLPPRRQPLILPLPGVGCAIDELQGSAVGIAEIRARTIDDPTLAIFLEEDLDAIGPQVVDGRPVIVRGKHEGMVYPIGTFELPDDGRRPLDEQHAHTAGVEKSHALVRQGMQQFAADDLCVEAVLLSDH